MKLALSVATMAIVAANAENYNQYASNQNSQNYKSGYFDEDGNWVSNYVQQMNEDDGNFQYYDADGDYDESYEVAGYFDENGNYVAYDYAGYSDEVDEDEAQEYYNEWQNAGGANGYYDNYGNWNENDYQAAPCQGYYSTRAYALQGAVNDGYNEAWENEDYQYQQVNNGNYEEYMNECDSHLDIIVENCPSSVVQVQEVTILCDSPYRSYYGNGGHMSSELCEYGDQALVVVEFDVLQDLDYHKNIYMTMGIYAGKEVKELLWAVRSVELCKTFVGHNCEKKGSYGFSFLVTLDHGTSDRALFVPMIEMGFSTKADEGYNVGGVNINCRFNTFYKQYNPWSNGSSAHASQAWGAGGLGALAGRFGILIGVMLLGIAFGLFTWSRKKQGIEFQGNADELMEKEVTSNP